MDRPDLHLLSLDGRNKTVSSILLRNFFHFNAWCVLGINWAIKREFFWEVIFYKGIIGVYKPLNRLLSFRFQGRVNKTDEFFLAESWFLAFFQETEQVRF